MATTPKKTGTASADQPEPIVYERSSSDDSDGYEYSEGTKDAQKLVEGTVNVFEKLTRAVADGVSTYKDKHYESAAAKEDGALRDIVENVGEGLSEALGTAAEAPRELTKKVSLKRLTRLATPIPLNIFLRR
jgi:hypothetical protein